MAVAFPNESDEFNVQMEEEGRTVAKLQSEVNDIDALLNEIAKIKHNENVVIPVELINQLIKYTLAYREVSNKTINDHFEKVSNLVNNQPNNNENNIVIR